MSFEKNDYSRDLTNLNDQCTKYLYCHIILTMTDGSKLDGIIENVNSDDIIMLVGEEVMDEESQPQSDEKRQNYGYNNPRRRFRHFRRRRFPIAKLAALSLLPYIVQQPYPYYPYYPYY